MWHDTILVSCTPVLDFTSCGIRRSGTGSTKLNCCLKPMLKLKRPLALVGVSGSSGEYRYLRSKTMEKLTQRARPFIFCESSIGRSSESWQGFPGGFRIVSILAQDNRPSLMVPRSSLTVSLSTVSTKKDAEALVQTHSDVAVHSQEDAEEENVCEREKLRRHRISVANKGRVPWNKGGKHSPQTIQRIRERTYQAMHSPKVMAKLKLNPSHPQTDETRAKIRDKLREQWDIKKRIRGYQEALCKDWRQSVAEAARKGGLGEFELEWNSYFVIKKRLRVEAVAAVRLEKMRKKQKNAMTSTIRSTSKSEEHRLKISAAIRAKWQDPEYQTKVREGMVKSGGVSKPRRKSSQRRRSPVRRTSRPDAGVVLGPLDQGFITAVMSDEERSKQRNLAVKLRHRDTGLFSPTNQTAAGTHRRVNLLKKTQPAEVVEENIFELDTSANGDLSVSAEHSFSDPLATEKLHKLKLIQVRRSVIDQRRREATQHARTLMAEAERAANLLEATAGNSEFVLASLNETRRVIAEAAYFIQAAESGEVTGADGSGSYNGVLWRNTMDFQEGSGSQLPTESRKNHVSI